jgi:hypothetical protein
MWEPSKQKFVEEINLTWNSYQFKFVRIAMQFEEERFTEVFAKKNNKTLRQTLTHKKYIHLAEESFRRYQRQLDTHLGEFLLYLKQKDDQFYKRFLNKYGDRTYSRFRIDDEHVLRVKGLYLYHVQDKIQYIGRCKDSFGKRINQGYGIIHPKNCFIDGQATNCHINDLITSCNDITLFICQIDDPQIIVDAEVGLIEQYQPPWNIQFRRVGS